MSAGVIPDNKAKHDNHFGKKIVGIVVKTVMSSCLYGYAENSGFVKWFRCTIFNYLNRD